MTAFSGMTLEQLEQEHQCCNGDEAVLAGLHRELVDRKRRREAGGKTEKPRAAHLRQVISQELGGHDKPTTNSSSRQQARPSELPAAAAKAGSLPRRAPQKTAAQRNGFASTPSPPATPLTAAMAPPEHHTRAGAKNTALRARGGARAGPRADGGSRPRRRLP